MVDLQPGVKIKNYTLERQLGRGASGEVWKAYDPFKTVAIKFMNETLMTSANVAKHRERMLREVEAMQKLQHPNIPALYDYDLDYVRPYIVMRYVGGDTYDKLIANGEMLRIPLERRMDLVRELASALQAAHEAGVIHRDLKPSNITGIENPYLLDFSISLDQREAEATQRFIGTTLYMSPDGQADLLADNFGFALVAYEIVFGRHAIWNPTDQIYNQYIAYERITTGKWRWPSKIPPNELPADLRSANLQEMDRVFSKAIGERETRYGDLRDFVRDLRAAVYPTSTSTADDDYVPTMMLSVADVQERMKSTPPIPTPAPEPKPAPVPSPPAASAPPAPAQPLDAPTTVLPAASAAQSPAPVVFPPQPPPQAPVGQHTELEIDVKTVPYDSLANRGQHPNAPIPDKTELDFNFDTSSQTPVSSAPAQSAGNKTELEFSFPSTPPMPAQPAAPRPPTPAQAPTPDPNYTLMEFNSVAPPAQNAPPQPMRPAYPPPPTPAGGGADFTMMEMQAPSRPAAHQPDSFTMMEMQAPQQNYQQGAGNFTMMEFNSAQVYQQQAAQPVQKKRKQPPVIVRIIILLTMLVFFAALVFGVLVLTGTVRFG